MDHDRPARRALDGWAVELRGKLSALGAEPPLSAGGRGAKAACMNLAALVVAHAGDLQTAERLCRLQLEWLARLASESGDPSVLGDALQPWINLGRLRVLRGDADGARPHFVLAEHLRDLRPVRLGPCRLPAGAWPLVVAADAGIPEVLWNVYAIDQLKAYLRAGDPEGALAFIPRLRRLTPPGTRRFVDEGEVLALLRGGRAGEALEKAAEADPATTADEMAFLLHRVAALAALGQEGSARRLAVGLTAIATRTEPRYATPPTFLRQLKRLGLLLETLGEERYALAVYVRGLDMCGGHEDEPLHLEFVEGALRLAPGHRASAEWRPVRDRLLGRSLYFEVRRRYGRAAEPGHAAIRDLVAAVESAAVESAA
ncbi:hypothetical protein [Planomonospora venezuelensis]|uniref:Uncharacterized protein n=1 Tax=Planomonospora venezuelensis TaxID=1999 RepID=A0A841D0J9_PLAVE|nr:hypothetical protein [Planomonospora venezuelensis]MBB5961715.1 hypothetical protein [Planomonospora venezuelensis]GIM98862.1 hypothetical protein Pve01_05210 [Planomonospora venezuelensis]